ncbi:hypothetical protein AA0242T_2826 [Acetobacter aceti NRIC 0242]|uniref:ATP-binding protein YghR n=1 Tax=Acetobacter aceti NBRC 14818 TaxID=887700 RepID=A0AB33IK20_ACEAC|nr:hypothetical protein [Acetobacter aceti]TCS32714.1 thymidylate kinase [Acetobacter aceti NBRC 14818]BCK77390.1 putative ATP-binding protein YghR [Acetobacter aceti NBRC 14818]GAN58448.1 hypothetical protein Abac_052_019 [Acetobacter aceti NBRC 14818]GBO82124.1 hypothetical protein AA0242T_2826 [Acetobacter aceti NRIC 0242]
MSQTNNGSQPYTAPRPVRAQKASLAPLVALIGCDGAGKTAISSEISAQLNQIRPTRTFYLGLGSGDLGRRIGTIPLIGPALEKLLTGKARKTRSKGEKIPGLVTALVVYGFSLLRYRRFLKMQNTRKHGIAVITDRYPQTEIPAFHDGPGLSAGRPGNRLVAALARSELRLYQKMTTIKPNLVIRLDVDPQTALNRKPDHDLATLIAKAATTQKLTFGGAPIVTIDARSPYEQVKKEVMRLCCPVILGTS